MKQFLKKIGLPVTLKDFGVNDAEPGELVRQAFLHGEEFLGGGLGRVYPSDADMIYKLLL